MGGAVCGGAAIEWVNNLFGKPVVYPRFTPNLRNVL